MIPHRMWRLLVSCALLLQAAVPLAVVLPDVQPQTAALANNSLPVFDSPLPTPPAPAITPAPLPVATTLLLSTTESMLDVCGGASVSVRLSDSESAE